MSILMNEIRSSLFCFGDSVVTNLHGIGSSIRISHNLNSLDRKISKLDRIREACSKTYDDEEPEVETSNPEEKSKVVYAEKEVSETVEFEENSNIIKKKPTEEKTEPVEKEKVEEVETPEETPKTEPVETATKSTEEDMATKPEETETPEEASNTEPIAGKKPEPAVQQKPKVELKKEDIDKIIDIANFQSKAEHKDTAAIIADSIINNIINNPNSDLNQKLASNIEQMTKAEEEPKEPTQKTTKPPTSRKSATPKKSSTSRKSR